MSTPSSSRGRPTALGKMVAVVEALAEQRRTSEIARMTGLPVSTVHRILQELVSVGWAREDGDRGYLLGARVLTLAARDTDHVALTSLARPHLQELSDTTGSAVHFGVRSGDEAVYVDKLEGSRAYRMRSRIGLPIPLTSTAIGKAVLAALPEPEVRMIVARAGLPARTPHSLTTVEALLADLAGVRERGYSLDEEENELQISCVGAAVYDHKQVPIGGISLTMLSFEMTPERTHSVVPLVMRTAAAITKALGGRD